MDDLIITGMLRKKYIKNDKQAYITDTLSDMQTIYSYAKNISTGEIVCHEKELDTFYTLDENGMPYKELGDYADLYEEYEIIYKSDNKNNYIPWPKGIKEPNEVFDEK